MAVGDPRIGTDNTEYHKWLKDDTIKIKLMKMSKGYQWELTYEAESEDIAITKLQNADLKLRAIYGEKEV